MTKGSSSAQDSIRTGFGLPNGGPWGDAGATWWSEYIPPTAGSFEEARATISRGPLR